MISDIIDVEDLLQTDIISNFDEWNYVDRHYTPYQQLMCIMPPASIKKLLPKSYHQFLEVEELKLYYPLDFEIDLNGKTTPWEAVILIPFVDENQIINHENLL